MPDRACAPVKVRSKRGEAARAAANASKRCGLCGSPALRGEQFCWRHYDSPRSNQAREHFRQAIGRWRKLGQPISDAVSASRRRTAADSRVVVTRSGA